MGGDWIMVKIHAHLIWDCENPIYDKIKNELIKGSDNLTKKDTKKKWSVLTKKQQKELILKK